MPIKEKLQELIAILDKQIIVNNKKAKEGCGRFLFFNKVTAEEFVVRNHLTSIMRTTNGNLKQVVALSDSEQLYEKIDTTLFLLTANLSPTSNPLNSFKNPIGVSQSSSSMKILKKVHNEIAQILRQLPPTADVERDAKSSVESARRPS